MKKILITIAICFIFTMGVAANSGSAVIPGFHIDKTSVYFITTAYYISNITPDPIDVELIIYKSDGTIMNDASNYVYVYNALNFDDTSVENTFHFSLAGNQTCGMSFNHNLYNGQYEIGYGIIKWTQNSNVVHGLVARGHTYYKHNSMCGYSSLTINEGQPF